MLLLLCDMVCCVIYVGHPPPSTFKSIERWEVFPSIFPACILLVLLSLFSLCNYNYISSCHVALVLPITSSIRPVLRESVQYSERTKERNKKEKKDRQKERNKEGNIEKQNERMTESKKKETKERKKPKRKKERIK